MDEKKTDVSDLIIEGAELMNETFDYVMDKSEEFTSECQTKTEEIEELNTFCVGPNDEITYFTGAKNQIVSYTHQDLESKIKGKLD
jgi:hypothetical protein